MTTLIISCIGKLKEPFWKEAEKEYQKRLQRFCTLVIREHKEEKLPDRPSQTQIDKALQIEGFALTKNLPPENTMFALDRKGKNPTSEEFSELISSNRNYPNRSLTFFIGSSYGLSESLKNSATCLSFSKMTFPHQLFRIVLLEQIYRSFKIRANETYHK